jgi:plastocyanin
MKKKMNSKKINVLIIVSAVVPILLLSGCTQQPNNPGTNTVSMKNLAFNPSTLSVPNGTTVTWINNDNVGHTVIAEGGLFSSGLLGNGQNFTYTFSTPGTYNYSCSIHQGMRGTIIVQ